MVQELEKLAQEGDPLQYYHWNTERAAYLKPKSRTAEGILNPKNWYQYCLELLNAGKSAACIQEIESTFNPEQAPYETLINSNSRAVFDLLALAYLRLGEQENCQHQHTPYSCILPLQTPALHQLPQGSTKAVELYQLLYDRFPTEKYKWLLNVAHMTLGNHPQKVPAKSKIQFPNWNLETQNFPRFHEKSMGLGVAVNGLSGGTCVEDFNQDGLLDIFATSLRHARSSGVCYFNDAKKEATPMLLKLPSLLELSVV